MDRERYIELLRADGDLLVRHATDLDAPIPTCPGWTVRDAVVHTGDVYVDKIACIELGGPEPQLGWPLEHPDDLDPVAYFREQHARLLDTFATMDDDAPAYIWWPGEGKAGLWVRRMAQETAVHSRDVESASRPMTPVPDDLAVDGVDEALALFMPGPWWDEEPWLSMPGTATVRTGGRAWHVVMGDGAVVVTESDAPADVTVTGEPSDTLLWLWGRLPDDVVKIEGDPTTFRRYLKATQ